MYNKDVLNKRNEAASFVGYLLYPPQKHTSEAVSYTHLDVYKRQTERLTAGMFSQLLGKPAFAFCQQLLHFAVLGVDVGL